MKYSQTEKGLVFHSLLWILLSLLVSHPSRRYFSYFFCLLYVCMYAVTDLRIGQKSHGLGPSAFGVPAQQSFL